jgi:two-component sensor histidine kinase
LLRELIGDKPPIPNVGARPKRISRAAATLLAVALVALIGWFDYVTGDFSLTVFYLLPVAIATWYAGRASGWFVGLLSVAVWLIGEIALGHTQSLMFDWNAAMLALVYGVVVHLLSALQRVQTVLEKRVERRTVSLAEVHHRVKNNLQVISSLLMLQGEKLTSPADKAVFSECRDRIYSMARLHEQLYSRGEFGDLDFGAHLQETSQMLVRSHAPPGCSVALQVRVDRVAVDLNTAVTLGLIADELILNALKHGFAGRTAGKLLIELHAADRCQMSVCDNGCGLPPGFDAKKSAGLGIELVLGMTQQIRGEAKIENDPAGGTRATILFPPPDPSTTAN